MPGDPRPWLGLYKINRDGFRSILPRVDAGSGRTGR
jgi:hypothetical protein